MVGALASVNKATNVWQALLLDQFYGRIQYDLRNRCNGDLGDPTDYLMDSARQPRFYGHELEISKGT